MSIKYNRDKLYNVASKICLKNGGNLRKTFTERQIHELWGEDEYPSVYWVLNTIRVKHIKWYIHNRITIDDPIWNADFIHGLTQNGEIKWNEVEFPSFIWKLNPNITELIKLSPFGGRLNKDALKQNRKELWAWRGVPSLYLKYDETSLSYLAGVLAPGQDIEIEKEWYIYYPLFMENNIKSFGIPIERFDNRFVYISPFWRDLLSIKMPEEYRATLNKHRKAKNAQLYALILWRAYIGGDFAPNKIPYLKSRRQIYNDFKGIKNVMKHIDWLRVETGLVDLDLRFGEVVKEWNNLYNKDKE